MKNRTKTLQLQLEQVQESQQTILNSPYRIRKSLIFIKEGQKSKQLINSFQDVRDELCKCYICNQTTGYLNKYCQCEKIYYHESCLTKQVKNKVRRINEGAFICDKGCQLEYRVNYQFKKNLTKCGKALILLILLLITCFIIILITTIIYWKYIVTYQQIYLIVILVLLCLITLIMSNRIKINLYIIEWNLEPINESKQLTNSFPTIIPFIHSSRDLIKLPQDNDTIQRS